MSATERLVLFAEDLADQFRVSPATARRWIAEGRLGPTVKVGRRRGVRRERVEAWLLRVEERVAPGASS